MLKGAALPNSFTVLMDSFFIISFLWIIIIIFCFTFPPKKLFSCGRRCLLSPDSWFSVYCPSSISSCGSETIFWSVFRKDTGRGLSLSSAAWLGTYWSETLSPALASGTGCTRFGPFSHPVQSYLQFLQKSHTVSNCTATTTEGL